MLGQLPRLPALAPRSVRLTLRHFRRELVTFRENFMVPDVLAPYNPEEGPPGAHAAPLIDARAAEWRLAKAPRVQDFGERFPPRRAPAIPVPAVFARPGEAIQIASIAKNSVLVGRHGMGGWCGRERYRKAYTHLDYSKTHHFARSQWPLRACACSAHDG